MIILLIAIMLLNLNDFQTSYSTLTIENQNLPFQFTSMTDPRDGEVYKVVNINGATWLAENLRYQAERSIINKENPNKSYGRLYSINSLPTACPKGWHLPTDEEWDTLEIAHGMPISFIGKGGWRGEHSKQLRSASDWAEDRNGNNKLEFNVFPAGYYFSEIQDDLEGIQGLGYSAAFWSSTVDGVTYARFIFGERAFVNKWQDNNNDSGTALSCRCVMDNG